MTGSSHDRGHEPRPSAQSRPSAQYGEYASPEEQAKARGVAPVVAHPEPTGYGVQAATTKPSEQGHPADRIVTLVLLAFGLFVVLSSIPGYLSMAHTMQQVYTQVGAGKFTATALAASLGITALVVQSILWVVTASFSVMALRRGRLAWWIPVVGGALAFVALMIIVSVALMADPGFMARVS